MALFDSHPSADQLEAYALGHGDADRRARIEEHLLVCERCQAELEHEEEYIRVLRAALSEGTDLGVRRRHAPGVSKRANSE